MTERWLLLKSGPCPASLNMAWDEALLEAMPSLGRPVLRFYGWTEPAASFGYFQKYAEIERLTLLRPLVRRPTGGGLVPHAQDWTYCLAFPTTHDWYSLTAIGSYQRVHEWIRLALDRIGIQAELATNPRTVAPGQCFSGYEQFDVLLEGRKIAGAAQRRRRDGLLIQGSIQPPPGLPRTQWEQAMLEVAVEREGIAWEDFRPAEALSERVAVLAAEKYASAAYNQTR